MKFHLPAKDQRGQRSYHRLDQTQDIIIFKIHLGCSSPRCLLIFMRVAFQYHPKLMDLLLIVL